MVKNALASTADEMALVIMRSAYSPVVRDTMDYSTALCDRNGRVVAQGLTLAVQLGTFPTVMRYVLDELGSTAQPGDVYISNDPYGYGGQHLPDIYVIKPIFVDGVASRAGPRRWRTTPMSAASRRAASPCTRPRSTRRGSGSRSRSSTTPASRTRCCCA